MGLVYADGMKALTALASLVTLTPLLTACHARVGSEIHVPEDATQTCQDQCYSIGLKLSAVAIMANNVGCVCQPFESGEEGQPVGVREAVTGGMATIMLQQQEQQQQQQQQQPSTY